MGNYEDILLSNEEGIFPYYEYIPKLYSHTHNVENLQLQSVLEHHSSCVNSVNWNSIGSHLISAGDDTSVGLWSYPQSKLLGSISTGHTQNIFCCKFLPSDRHIVTCAGDSKVKLFDVETKSIIQQYDLHRGAIKRIETAPRDPNYFLCCGADGKVIEFDRRDPNHKTLIQTNYPLNSVSVSQVKPTYLAIAGYTSTVSIFDRRSNRATAWKELITYDSDIPLMTSVKFASSSMELIAYSASGNVMLANLDIEKSRNDYMFINFVDEIKRLCFECRRFFIEKNFDMSLQAAFAAYHVTEEKFSFDFVFKSQLMANISLIYLRRRKEGDLENAHQKAQSSQKILHSIRNPRSSLILSLISKLKGNQVESVVQAERGLNNMERTWKASEKELQIYYEGICQTLDVQRTEKYISELQLLDCFEAFENFVLNRFYSQFNVTYKGALNHRTIKDCNFFGLSDEYIVAGSDDGCFYVWHKNSTEIQFVGKSDNTVVNCVQPHPTEPTLAVSGIDRTVKIWNSQSVKNSNREFYPLPKEDWRTETPETFAMSVRCPVQ